MVQFFRETITVLFYIDIGIHYVLLAGILWSIASPQKRIWPPPKKRSWQRIFTWACFYAVFSINALLIVFDWNSGPIPGTLRYLVGIPLVVVGTMLVSWGIAVLGAENTSGVKDGFIRSGPYRFTRNPQYLGDILLFIGLVLVSNSSYLFAANALLSLVFLLTPLAEEPWLEEQYGEDYLAYKQATSRFF